MLRSTKDLDGLAIRAVDGNVGHLTDLYFDDIAWTVRYLVVDTGTWLSSRKVLVSPIAVDVAGWTDHALSVGITQAQVKNSPDVDVSLPVSRQNEMRFLSYYGYPSYWNGAGLWGDGAMPSSMITGMGYGGADAEYRLRAQGEHGKGPIELLRPEEGDAHVRSCMEVTGYHIEATDGEIGHVDGFLVDDETFAIRYIVVNTSNWWMGHKVLISPQWIQEVRWADEIVAVALTRDIIKDSPPYDSSRPLDRATETGLYEHYGRATYWDAATSGRPVQPRM
jgi:hypothetical protein